MTSTRCADADAAGLRDELGGLGRGRVVDVGAHNGGAGLGEPARDRTADAAARPGDDGDAVGDRSNASAIVVMRGSVRRGPRARRVTYAARP